MLDFGQDLFFQVLFSLCFSCDIGVVFRGVRVGVVDPACGHLRQGRERPVLLINTGRRRLWVFVMIGRRPGGVMNRSRVARMGRGRHHGACRPGGRGHAGHGRHRWRRPRMRAARETTVRAARPAAFPRACSGSTRTTRPAASVGRERRRLAAHRVGGGRVQACRRECGERRRVRRPGAIRDTLRGALSKCVAGFRQRHPGEGDGDCRVVGVGSGRRPAGRQMGVQRIRRLFGVRVVLVLLGLADQTVYI